MVSDVHTALPVVETKLAAHRQVLLTLDASGTGLPEAHLVPGQYARLALEDGVFRTMAIASPPPHLVGGGCHFEFLLKLPEDRIAPLLVLGSDDKIGMSKPQGKGFPLEHARGKHLMLFAVGSGIAPLRAVIESLLPRRTDFRDVTLLYGVRDTAELAFSHRFGTWAGHGVQVLPVVSQPRPDTWSGKTGHIQDHLPKSIAEPSETVAFLCGLPAMDKDVAARLLERGVAPEQVFRNW